MSHQEPLIRQKVIKLAQELLLDEHDRSAITPAMIATKIELVIAMQPKWGALLDRVAAIDELIRRCSVWIGKDTALKNNVGHEPWLDSARKRDWRYWNRYKEWIERKLSWTSIEALDRSTDTVLGLLEDPTRIGFWDRRGLVVGHVQSGKTSHYTALINKAADAGFKIIIVLAGLHKNLRTQTQIRLEEGFLGYQISGSSTESETILGVGEIDSDRNIHPNCATNRSNSGDFSTKIARHLAISPEERPWLFVVKKNKTVLRELLKWIQNHAADTKGPPPESANSQIDDLPKVKKIVTKLPLLVIDDEADHASVDTQVQVFDADGSPDDEHRPTTINRLIRRILHSFSRSAYVGYTATPFANIFIHERNETNGEGPDLFPSAFIINLAAPSNYIGPASVFGLMASDNRKPHVQLVRDISDHSMDDDTGGWMPNRHVNGYTPRFLNLDTIPPSLAEAIDAFLLACAARRIRGQGNDHASMLVHVTRFTSVQKEVHRQVEQHVRNLRQRLTRNIGREEILGRLKALWDNDFLPTTKKTRAFDVTQVPTNDHSWDDISVVLPDTSADIEVRMINGTAKDVLDYTESGTKGLKVIAIGGDKLSRGLTLEGLCVSYFLRASKMYDTLMQMGRWFGYRPGYLDLCRLYTTKELSEWFRHITDAAEELREEFDLMAASGATPEEYGLKVQSHAVLMVTSRLKMRTAKDLMLSFSGQLLETISFFRDEEVLTRNLEATKRLLTDLSNPEVPKQVRRGVESKWDGFLWRDVPATHVVDFLNAYKTHPDAYKVNSQLLSEFINSMNTAGELTNWTIALIGGGEGDRFEFTPGIAVQMLKRSNNRPRENRYTIGRLLSPRDEAIDLDEAAWEAALKMTREAWHSDPARLRGGNEPDTPSGVAIRRIRGFGANGIAAHPERGLLLIYALDPLKADSDFPKGTPPVIAFGITFPASNSGTKVEYKVNNVLWEKEYGTAD